VLIIDGFLYVFLAALLLFKAGAWALHAAGAAARALARG